MVEYHDEAKNGFNHSTRDDEWLDVVCAKKWIVISHDKRFHNDSLAIAAIRQHGGRVFYFDGGSSVKWDKLRLFAARYRKMRSVIEKDAGPFIYRVTYDDRIRPVRLVAA